MPLSPTLQPLGTCLGAPAHWQAPGGQGHKYTSREAGAMAMSDQQGGRRDAGL